MMNEDKEYLDKPPHYHHHQPTKKIKENPKVLAIWFHMQHISLSTCFYLFLEMAVGALTIFGSTTFPPSSPFEGEASLKE